ncbi:MULTISPECIES: IclR family transcriptional regulator [Micrococcaceae]|uniref:IclR family transcriptional regulator n=3 Tax=Micrococcales TaxID=85006 RepID=UPI00161FBC51|nr:MULTISPECIES: IclR family transcriptional regulator [Micrococcaceae]MBB5750765.1 DNA-binding IclR family transcriptional regulator [Micrococcus sp. TA1]HRO31159.1 IclR family transcriptional regulator [Citricoccus sp.]
MTPASDAPSATSASENGARGASVIVNVLQVIRCFTSDEPLQGVTEIAAQVGLHKSSVSRILATLEQEHVVERDEASRKYRLGLGLIAVAGPLLANLDVRRVAMEDLQTLREVTEETVALAIWDGSAAVTVEQVPSPQKIKHTSAMGSRYSTGLSASVQVPLAHMDPDHVRQLLDDCPIRLDGHITPDQYLERLADVRRNGYAVNYGETSDDEVGVAAPVFDHRGEVVATILVAAPRYRVPESALPQLTRACTTAARRVSQRLGAPVS